MQIWVYLISHSDGDKLKAMLCKLWSFCDHSHLYNLTSNHPSPSRTASDKKLRVVLSEENVVEKTSGLKSNLFMSDMSGTEFAVALKDVRYVPLGAGPNDDPEATTEVVDVYKVDCQPGAYIANIVDDLDLVTYITFNKGAHWQLLSAPADVV